MGKDAQDPFYSQQLYHMVSSGNSASCISEHVAEVIPVDCLPPQKWLSREREAALQMLTIWLWFPLLHWAWCVEPPTRLHKSKHISSFSFFFLPYSNLFGIFQVLHCVWRPSQAMHLFRFQKCQVVGTLGYIYSVFEEWLLLMKQEISFVLGSESSTIFFY